MESDELRSWIRSVMALARIAGLLATGYLKVRFARSWLRPAQGDAMVRRWCEEMLRALGVRFSVAGHPLDRCANDSGLLIVANHVSWIDTLAIRAALPCGFLAKDSLRHWPVVGPLIAGTGGVFVQRGNPFDLERALGEMGGAVTAGRSICVFPEGTTTDGASVAGFATPVFELAVRHDIAVLPMGVRYLQDGEPSRLPAWVGDEAFLPSLLRIVRARGLEVRLVAGRPLRHVNDRQRAAEEARRAVGNLLCVPFAPDPVIAPTHTVLADASARTSDIAEAVRRWITDDRQVQPHEIGDHASLRSLGIDSLSILRIVVELEQRLGLRVDEAKLDLSSRATVLELSAAVANAER